MKVTIRKAGEDQFSVYLPKKDLEEPVVSRDRLEFWGSILELAGGMRLQMPEMPAETRFPVTVEARRVD